MKKIILLSFLVVALFSSCNKNVINNTEDKVGVSTVTHYVTLELNGSAVMSIVKGESFTDPGVVAKEGDEEVTATVTGTVDPNTTGIYTITYTAVNKDGFPSSATRTVVVIPAHENDGSDISGQYAYIGSTTYTATITKVAEGVYSTDNCWSGSTIIPAILVCIDGENITVPEQTTAYGPFYGSATLDATGKLVYTVSIPNFGIFDSVRNWQKQ
jgi:hypothetical protein